MKISMEHGSGGRATGELIDKVFANAFDNPVLAQMEDCAVVPGNAIIAMTTDSFVVTPLIFPGGDIGRLCICGTVNDLLMRGAVPKYITCGFILQEGADTDVLQKIVHSMAVTAKEAGVIIVAGDTKVVEGDGGIMINTAGVGFVPDGVEISAKKCTAGDVVIASGTMGDHHGAILSSRMEIDNSIESDNAPLGDMVHNLINENVSIHTFRDVTRGGLATVLKEIALATDTTIVVSQEAVPVTPQVKDFCGLLGLDPMYMGNEGKLIAIVPADCADRALSVIKKSRYGENAAIIGKVEEGAGELIIETPIGGRRRMDVLQGEGLPRIC